MHSRRVNSVACEGEQMKAEMSAEVWWGRTRGRTHGRVPTAGRVGDEQPAC
jgi:hypothetical protein